jgi:KDO2-lipid IV(A) lauroyltransferase
VHAVAREVKNPLATDWLTKTRTQDNVKILFRGRAGIDVLRAVKRGEAVGIPCDINTTTGEGIFVDFFGVPAATTPAPAEISLCHGPPRIIAFAERKQIDRYLVRFGPVLRPEEFKDKPEPVHAMMLAVNKEIENVIRRDPTQYLWGHRRWNTRPPGDTWKPNY